MLHFGVTKKDPGLHFHFHVQNLFKFQSKLGLTEHENEHNKFKKKIKNEKPVHIILLCHILTITVHKQVINILELYIQPSDQMGLFVLPLGLFFSSFWRTAALLKLFTLPKGLGLSTKRV